jgi:hypothetical protein
VVNQRCQVDFSIGPHYSTTIRVDVVSMDASHLILDWSWYFDNHAMYNGRQHLYSVKTAKKKVHILPMQKDFLSSRKTLLCVLTEEFELEL